jgi:hypothetical protein
MGGGGGGSPAPPPPSCPHSGEVVVKVRRNLDQLMYYDEKKRPGGTKHVCKYDKDTRKLGLLKRTLQGEGANVEYGSMVDNICMWLDNAAFALPDSDGICAEQSSGRSLAKAFCLRGENMVEKTTVCNERILGGTATHGVYGEALLEYCSRDGKIISHQACKNLNEGDYQRLAAAHCVANPTDSFCSCYNIMNDVCKSNSSAAGCAEKKNKFDKLVAGTPEGQKQLWSGLEKCFGGVCSGAGKYLPPGHDLRCNSSVNICVQNVEVGSLNDSGMNIVCDIDSSSGSGVSDGGGGGGGGGGDVPTVSVSDFKTNPRSYIPKSLDGLKNDTRQKTGAAIGGTVLMSFVSALLLLVLIMSIGGGGRRGLRR